MPLFARGDWLRHLVRTAGVVVSVALIAPAAAHQAAEIEAATALAPQLTLDKLLQRRLGLRTQLVTTAAPAVALPAQVVADPRRQVLLTADQAGIIEAPSGGFADAGATVHAGQVLALLQPLMPVPEQRDLETDLAYARRDVELGKTQIKRYGIDMAQKFDVKLPTPSLQVVLDYRTAESRAQQYGDALGRTIALRAPADGVLLHASLRRGTAVASGAPLFELDERNARAIELLLSDPGLDSAAALHATTRAGRDLPIAFISESYDPVLRLQRALYVPTQAADQPPIGEPLQVQVPRLRAADGHWRVPSKAIVDDQGTSWIWVHEQAETFVAHPVTRISSEAGWTEIDAALDEDDRVVVEGAMALRQRADVQAPRS